MSEPREWWLEARPHSREEWVWVAFESAPHNPYNIHVIEKSAYDELKAENEQLKARVQNVEYHLDRVLSLAENYMDPGWTQFEQARAALEEKK